MLWFTQSLDLNLKLVGLSVEGDQGHAVTPDNLDGLQ